MNIIDKLLTRYTATALADELGVRRETIWTWRIGRYWPRDIRPLVALAERHGLRITLKDTLRPKECNNGRMEGASVSHGSEAAAQAD